MGHIENLEQSLLEGRKEWVSRRIGELKRVRKIIEDDFAKGRKTTKVPFVNSQVGDVNRLVALLEPWFNEEPSKWGDVKLSIANDDRNNVDYLIAQRD